MTGQWSIHARLWRWQGPMINSEATPEDVACTFMRVFLSYDDWVVEWLPDSISMYRYDQTGGLVMSWLAYRNAP